MTENNIQTQRNPVFLRRLVLKDYKSVVACDLRLNHLTVFVGPNGSGKSNILDSLRFVSDSLRYSLQHAIRNRGGIDEIRHGMSSVRRRAKGHPSWFGIRLEMNLDEQSQALFAFSVRSSEPRGFAVKNEVCQVIANQAPYKRTYYRVREGGVTKSSLDLQSAVAPDRLYLGAVSAIPEFRQLYDALTRMGFYSLNPERIRELQDPDPTEILARDGRNVTSILRQLGSSDNPIRKRIAEYLEAVVPGIKGIEIRRFGPKETIEFRQEVLGAGKPWRFLAANMSDGTLRVLGVLVALFQGGLTGKKPIPLVGIEEPESTIHPGAAIALAEAILEATNHTQVLVTSHSPDLIDNDQIGSDSIIAVLSDKGQTIAGPVDDASRDAVKGGLYTPGELLRIQQIQPKPSIFGKRTSRMDLFALEVGR